VVTKEWNGLIDFQIEGACDEWVELVNIELSNVEKMAAKRSSKNKLNKTNNEIQVEKKRKKVEIDLSNKRNRNE
ncbi:18255_t:CDS:1, partial [Cetraspora pellucida]